MHTLEIDAEVVSLATFTQQHQLTHLINIQNTQKLHCVLDGKDLATSIDAIDCNTSKIFVTCECIADASRQSLCLLNTTAHGEITRLCQRCLEPIQEKIHVAVQWQLVHATNQWNTKREGYEILTRKEYIGILPLFFQEIMLSIANIPMHQPENCPLVVDKLPHNSHPLNTTTNNQFAVLEQYKQMFKRTCIPQSNGD